jgi:hypothetical protein
MEWWRRGSTFRPTLQYSNTPTLPYGRKAAGRCAEKNFRPRVAQKRFLWYTDKHEPGGMAEWGQSFGRRPSARTRTVEGVAVQRAGDRGRAKGLKSQRSRPDLTGLHDVPTVQEILGLNDMRTTMIYTQSDDTPTKVYPRFCARNDRPSRGHRAQVP